MDNIDLDKIINEELNKFGVKTVRQLKGTLPIKTGKLVSNLEYDINDKNLSLFSTHYFKYVLVKYSPRSQKVINENIDELMKNLGDGIMNEISIKIDTINVQNLT